MCTAWCRCPGGREAHLQQCGGQFARPFAESLKFSDEFFRIHNPKNLSRTETLQTKSDAYKLICCEKMCTTVTY